MSIMSHIVRTLFTIGDLKRDLGWKKPRNVDSVENLSYGQDDKWHLLDVYRPRKATGPLPVIVNIHGGAGVYGDNDLQVPTANSYEMHEKIAGSKLIIYPNAGHGSIFQYAEEFSKELLAFLAE